MDDRTSQLDPTAGQQAQESGGGGEEMGGKDASTTFLFPLSLMPHLHRAVIALFVIVWYFETWG